MHIYPILRRLLKLGRRFKLCSAAPLLTICLAASFGQAVPAQSAGGAVATVTVTVSAHDKAPPSIPAADVTLRIDGKPVPIISWTPALADGSGLDLAILVDEDLSPNLATRWSQFQDFIRSLPPRARVAIAYVNHGSARADLGFTTDHERAAAALHLPAPRYDPPMGVYDAISSLLQQWPMTKTPGLERRRVLLLLGPGYDSHVTLLFNDEPLRRAITLSQASGIAVFSLYLIYYNPGVTGTNFFAGGQQESGALTSNTGGRLFSIGPEDATSFLPFLNELAQLLAQQYSLTFAAQPPPKGNLSRMQIKVATKGVDILSADHAPAPVSK